MIFKIHYGLWYGGLVGIIPFMFNYAVEYSGATGTQHGVLYTILPFVALLAKPTICSIADKYAAHHHCLLFFIAATIIGYGSLAVYPFFPDLVQNHKSLIWVLYCISALIGNTSMCVVNSIGDSLAINSCQKKDISYGAYRLWGPIGFGIFGAIWGIANEIPTMPKYTPGIITMVVILIINSLLLAFWYDKDEFEILDKTTRQNVETSVNYGSTDVDQRLDPSGDNDNTGINSDVPRVERIGLLMKLCRQHCSIFAYIFLFTFCGIMTGIHWQFFFRYLEQVAAKDQKSFSTIATLALPVQALGGELVFFMLSGTILKKLGTSITLIFCLMSFAARYLLYAFLIPNVNVYWILLVELLQGPAFGLMYSVLTHQASYYSCKIDEIVAESANSSDFQLKNSLHATLQGVLGASFEGLGLGLGAIIGGRAYDTTPILMWQIAGYSALVVSLVCLVVTVLKPFFQRQDISNETVQPDETSNIPPNVSNIHDSDKESYVLEELARIARYCKSGTCGSRENPKPTMEDIRFQLEELAKQISSPPNGADDEKPSE